LCGQHTLQTIVPLRQLLENGGFYVASAQVERFHRHFGRSFEYPASIQHAEFGSRIGMRAVQELFF